MARVRIKDTAVEFGLAGARRLPRAEVYVTNPSGNLVTLYAQSVGGDELPNPVKTDVAGLYDFYVEDGVSYVDLRILNGSQPIEVRQALALGTGGDPGTVDTTARATASAAQATATSAETTAQAAQAASTNNSSDITGLGDRILTLETAPTGPDLQFRTRALFNTARSSSTPPSDSAIVLIVDDESNGGATVTGTALSVENLTGGGASSTIVGVGVDQTARDSAAAAQTTADSALSFAQLTDAALQDTTASVDSRLDALEAGGGGGGSTIDQTARDAASAAQTTADNNEIAIAALQLGDNSFRTFESFGGNNAGADDFEDALSSTRQTANDAAILSARDFCRDTGGQVTFGGGQYAFSNPFEARSFTNLMGMGGFQTRLVWPTGQDAIITRGANNQSPLGISLQHLRISNNTWNHGQSIANATQYAAIRILGQNNGPDEPEAYAREGVSYLSDPYHRFVGLEINEFDGNGIWSEGRGEMIMDRCVIKRVSGYGSYMISPDNWMTHCTVSETGMTGIWYNAGNIRSDNNKAWFTGKLTNETIGAGFEFTGSGKSNVHSVGDFAQDTWGPAAVIEGGHILLDAFNFTEPAGGRLEAQGDGFQGTRTEPRCGIRFENAKACIVRGTCANNNYQGLSAGNLPHYTYHANSGARANDVELYSDSGNWNANPTLEVAGFANNKRWSRVLVNQREVLGEVTSTQLADSAYAFNDEKYKPQHLWLNDGRLAKAAATGWNVSATTTSVTPS